MLKHYMLQHIYYIIFVTFKKMIKYDVMRSIQIDTNTLQIKYCFNNMKECIQNCDKGRCIKIYYRKGKAAYLAAFPFTISYWGYRRATIWVTSSSKSLSIALSPKLSKKLAEPYLISN